MKLFLDLKPAEVKALLDRHKELKRQRTVERRKTEQKNKQPCVWPGSAK
jgi:hypothetical protein